MLRNVETKLWAFFIEYIDFTAALSKEEMELKRWMAVIKHFEWTSNQQLTLTRSRKISMPFGKFNFYLLDDYDMPYILIA